MRSIFSQSGPYPGTRPIGDGLGVQALLKWNSSVCDHAVIGAFGIWETAMSVRSLRLQQR